MGDRESPGMPGQVDPLTGEALVGLFCCAVSTAIVIVLCVIAVRHWPF